MEQLGLSEQEAIRRESLKSIEALGVEAYPAEAFEINVTTEQLRNEYDKEKENFSDISIAGRIMTRRIMGAAAFFRIARRIRTNSSLY